MQSVGKSAVLSRISGISFPQDSEVCTRVAIELRLRRRQWQEEESNTMKIYAGCLEDYVEIDKFDRMAVQEALRDAQQKVLGGRLFEDKLSVKVEKEDKDIPEVTLIDLPGVFFAKDDGSDDLEEQVNNMINERVRNDMALILHVVPLNQDTDTVSTWRTVRDADKEQVRTISILTKADLALKDGRDILKKRIKKILEDSKSSECFVVHGSVDDSKEEEIQLAAVVNVIDELRLDQRVKVGIKELNEFIEDKMLNHVRDRLPEMRQLLSMELDICSEKLKKLGRHPISPTAIAFRDAEKVKSELKRLFSEHQPQYRKSVEEMAQNIFGIEMEPQGIIDASKAKTLLEKQCTDPSFLTDRIHKHYLLALEVKKIGEKSRELVNVPFVGKRKELNHWLGAFADSMGEIAKTYVEEIFHTFHHEIFLEALAMGCSPSTSKVKKILELLIAKDFISETKNVGIEQVNFLVKGVRGNMYTSNTHYLTDTAKSLESHMRDIFEVCGDQFKADMQPHFDTYCGILAFLKTRKKMLSDAIQVCFTQVLDNLCELVGNKIGELFVLPKHLDLIYESERTIVQREIYLNREKKIKSGLEEISLL